MKISWVNNRLIERGIEVITEKDHFIHVSGHPAREELKRMYKMVRPRIAVPTHGEPRHLHEHARLAKELGVKETVLASNGAVVWLAEGEASVIGKVQSGYIAVDGVSLISTDGDVIRTRRKLRDDGALFVSVVLGKNGDLAYPVQIVGPGILDAREDAELLEECVAEVSYAVENGTQRASDNQVKEQVRLMLRKMFKKSLDKKPVIEVLVARV
jgi:ribonuclease J